MDGGHLPIALQMKSKLLDLVELKNAGAITDDEFVANKRELLAAFLGGGVGSAKSLACK